MSRLKICTIKREPQHGGTIAQPSSGGQASNGRLQLTAHKDYMWKPGSTLTVRLIGGTDRVREKVEQYAKTWLDHANLKMNFVKSGDADIRVTFDLGGSWSFLGNSCLTEDPSNPTMNFGWFDDSTPESEFSRTVIHEFGHALGCVHEHQNPDGRIMWNKPNVYHYYQKQMGWSKEKTNNNIFDQYDRDSCKFSNFDEHSIMLYTIPPTFTTNGYCVRQNDVLSDMDKRFIANMYPGNPRNPRNPKRKVARSVQKRQRPSRRKKKTKRDETERME